MSGGNQTEFSRLFKRIWDLKLKKLDNCNGEVEIRYMLLYYKMGYRSEK